MKEAIFILFVVFLLFGFTVIRYRKQIAGMIGFARALKDAKDMSRAPTAIPSQEQGSVQLVNCMKCGVWVPQNKARKIGDVFFCSDECLRMQKPAR